MERRKADAEELRVSDTARVVLDGKAVSGAQGSEGSREQTCPCELRVGWDQRASFEPKCSVSSAGGLAEKEKRVPKKTVEAS